MAVTRWRTAYSIPAEWSSRAAESVLKEHERIYLYLSRVATELAALELEFETAGGDVDGPASSVDNEIVLFDGTTGKLIKAATGTGIVSATAGVYSVSTLTALLDALLGSAQGTVAFRGAAVWEGLAPGVAGDVLTSGGAAADVLWTAGGGGVCTPLTDGDLTQPELIFALGDVVMVCV